MTGRIKDITGISFGRLVATGVDNKHAGRGRGRAIFWFVVCTCGNTRSVRGTALRAGEVKSCGCLQREASSRLCRSGVLVRGQHKPDLTGRVYGYLTVVARSTDVYVAPNGKRRPKWVCICRCGRAHTVLAQALPKTQSCGKCGLREARRAQALSQRSEYRFTNQKFGRLTAIRRVSESGPGIWLCQCACGNETRVSSSHWGRNISCGCVKLRPKTNCINPHCNRILSNYRTYMCKSCLHLMRVVLGLHMSQLPTIFKIQKFFTNLTWEGYQQWKQLRKAKQTHKQLQKLTAARTAPLKKATTAGRSR